MTAIDDRSPASVPGFFVSGLPRQDPREPSASVAFLRPLAADRVRMV
jgi:hypothetical protein